MTLPPAIFLMGPTAAGKTQIAVELVARLPLEIISVDSAMVYKGLDIGTAKPDKELLKLAPHHLIDLREPTQPYSVGEFLDDAREVVAKIQARGNVPLFTGGTMLYFRALQSGLAAMPARDVALRAQLDAQAAREGWPALHRQLAAVDALSSQRISPNDGQRIQRALEVFMLSGQPLSVWQQQNLRESSAQALKLILAPSDRAVLHQRIEMRLAQMMQAGFLEEVQGLYARGDLKASDSAMRAVGYRQLWSLCAGELSYPQAMQAALVATRQLAKRQLTWLRAEPEATWFDSQDGSVPAAVQRCVQAWLSASPRP